MLAPAFVHLRLHSEFSIVDGLTRIGAAVERAAADGMPGLALGATLKSPKAVGSTFMAPAARSEKRWDWIEPLLK